MNQISNTLRHFVYFIEELTVEKLVTGSGMRKEADITKFSFCPLQLQAMYLSIVHADRWHKTFNDATALTEARAANAPTVAATTPGRPNEEATGEVTLAICERNVECFLLEQCVIAKPSTNAMR